jgi:hypothetical protein
MARPFSIPRRRAVIKSGIQRAAQRSFPRHRAFVRKHECCVAGCANRDIEFCHVRSAANSGTSLKPSDAYGISLCAAHHRQQHSIGQREFEKRHSLDLWALAEAFIKASPDTAMRESTAPQTVE